MTTNKTVLSWIDEIKQLVTPDNVVWIDGSDEQREELRALAVELGYSITKTRKAEIIEEFLSQEV